MLPIGQTIRGCGTKSPLNFVPGYRNNTITLLMKPKIIRKLCGTMNKVYIRAQITL